MAAVLRRLKFKKKESRDDIARESLQEHLYEYSNVGSACLISVLINCF